MKSELEDNTTQMDVAPCCYTWDNIGLDISGWGEVVKYRAPTVLKMIGETPEVRSDKRKQREERGEREKREREKREKKREREREKRERKREKR